MTAPESATESRLSTGGWVPVLVAVWANIGVLVWMLIRSADDVRWGYVGGPIALAVAAYACHRLIREADLARPVRTFWRRLEFAAASLTITAVITLARANNNAGMSPWVAVPMLVGVGCLMAAFLGLPAPRRTALCWLRAVLDTVTIALASGLIFWYVVLDLAPAHTSLVNKVVAAVVGVGGVLLLVVVGKAAAAPESVVYPAALRVLTTGPITCVVGWRCRCWPCRSPAPPSASAPICSAAP
jgi:hypothetical protein